MHRPHQAKVERSELLRHGMGPQLGDNALRRPILVRRGGNGRLKRVSLMRDNHGQRRRQHRPVRPCFGARGSLGELGAVGAKLGGQRGRPVEVAPVLCRPGAEQQHGAGIISAAHQLRQERSGAAVQPVRQEERLDPVLLGVAVELMHDVLRRPSGPALHQGWHLGKREQRRHRLLDQPPRRLHRAVNQQLNARLGLGGARRGASSAICRHLSCWLWRRRHIRLRGSVAGLLRGGVQPVHALRRLLAQPAGKLLVDGKGRGIETRAQLVRLRQRWTR